MADPLIALMYAVQVMNLLKTLVLKTLRERKNLLEESSLQFHFEPSNENGHHSPLQSCQQNANEASGDEHENCISQKTKQQYLRISQTGEESRSLSSSSDHPNCDEGFWCKFSPKANAGKIKIGRPSNLNARWKAKKARVQQPTIHGKVAVEKRGISNLSRLDSRSERIEAWR